MSQCQPSSLDVTLNYPAMGMTLLNAKFWEANVTFITCAAQRWTWLPDTMTVGPGITPRLLCKSLSSRVSCSEKALLPLMCRLLALPLMLLSNHKYITKTDTVMRHWQLIRSKLEFYFSSGITLDIDVFIFGALPIDQLKIEHTKKLKETPSRLVLENLTEKN